MNLRGYLGIFFTLCAYEIYTMNPAQESNLHQGSFGSLRMEVWHERELVKIERGRVGREPAGGEGDASDRVDVPGVVGRHAVFYCRVDGGGLRCKRSCVSDLF